MALDESLAGDDIVQDVDGLLFVFAKRVAYLMQGLKIDYAQSWFGKQLLISSAFAGGC